jgi:hypothetical protein
MDIDGKPFTDLLGEIEGGRLLRDLTKAAYEVTRAAMEVRKAGSIKLSITITPTGRGATEIDAKIDVKIPEHERPSTTFFVTPDGTLLRDDPQQQKLPLREVADYQAPLREVK